MSDSESATKRGGSSVAATAGAALVLVYFLCPHVYLLPFKFVYGGMDRVPPSIHEVIEVAVAPVTFLYERVPPYRALIDKESEIFGIH